VQAQSAGQDQGATFIVTLPCTAPDSSITLPPPPFTDSSSDGGIVRLDGVRVLVVDDDKDAVKLAEAILARAGADVRTCLRAEEALEALKQWQPDVLVSDIEMPGEDGYSLIRKVRTLAADEGGDTPAVALTAYGRMQDRHRAIAAGYDMHVPKPVDPGELTAIIAGISDRPLRF
jgi:CheY-like chemotaxis protein